MVATSRDILVLPWRSRDALLARMRGIEAARSAVEAFEAVGSSRPVRLDQPGKRTVVESIRAWAAEIGARKLPAGVWQLGDGLADDLRASAGDP
jgi:hypothetical protein